MMGKGTLDSEYREGQGNVAGKEDERQFHDDAFGRDTRKGMYSFYRVCRPANEEYLRNILTGCKGKSVLEYGCGSDGGDAFALARAGARVIGIDISPVAIEKSVRLSAERQTGDAVEFRLCDAEHLPFSEGAFDLVVGRGIIHHLDVEKALREIRRVLKPGGRAIFLEPLGHNPVIRIFRKLTPRMRTRGEHPLLKEDTSLFRNGFERVHFSHWGILTLVALPFVRFSFFETLLEVLGRADERISKLGNIATFLSWQILIIADDPKSP